MFVKEVVKKNYEKAPKEKLNYLQWKLVYYMASGGGNSAQNYHRRRKHSLTKEIIKIMSLKCTNR